MLVCLICLQIHRFIIKAYSKCLQHSGKVFILCRSLIFSRSKPFRPKEQLMSAEGAIFLITDPWIVYYCNIIGSTFLWVGLRKKFSSLPHGFIFVVISDSFLHTFGWTYVFLAWCYNEFHVNIMQYKWEYIFHLVLLRITWDPDLCTYYSLDAWCDGGAYGAML